MTAGSPGWLLRHELRLAWRTAGGGRMWLLLLFGGALWAAVHFVAWGSLSALNKLPDGQIPVPAIAIAGGVFWLFASIMVSQTVAHAVAALFDRGDLDLLLASPIPQRTVFLVRGIGIALSACLLPALLMFPFAHAGVVVGRWGLLGIYPVVIALALGSAAAGMALTMSLVALLGARRAKTVAQIMAALIGAGFFLVSQMQNMLSGNARASLSAWLRHEIQPGGWLEPESMLWWPVRAMLGEVLPILCMLAIGVGSFWFVVNLTYRRFVAGTQESGAAGKTRASKSNGPVTFTSGAVQLILFKEWKLLARDPQIISQTLLQILYLIPLVFLGLRGDKTSFMLIPGLVMMTAMLAGNLAWLTIAAEDAPELVGTSPVPISQIRWIKALAAMLPVAAMLVPLVLWWLPRDPAGALALVVCSGGGMLSACVVQIWNPRRGNRRDLKQRYKQSKFLNFLEAFGSMGWAAAAFCLNGHWVWLPLALALAACGPAAAWLLGRKVRAEGVLA
jgi:ABC-2 type transport system permease protein